MNQNKLVNYTYQDLLQHYHVFLEKERLEHNVRLALHFQALYGLRLQTLYKQPIWEGVHEGKHLRITPLKGSMVIHLKPRFTLPNFVTLRQGYFYHLRLYLKRQGFNLDNTQLPFRKAILAHISLMSPSELFLIDTMVMGHTAQGISRVTQRYYLNNVQAYIEAFNKFEQLMSTIPLWAKFRAEL